MASGRPEGRSIRPKPSTLLDEFSHHYDLALAHTDEELRAVFALRSRACQPQSQRDSAELPEALPEPDLHDDRSLHCLLTLRSGGAPVGCVSLIGTFDESTRLPMESRASQVLDAPFLKPRTLQRASLSEIACLTVQNAVFLDRETAAQNDSGSSPGESKVEDANSLPKLSLLLAAIALAELEERSNCFAMLEPGLPAILQRYNLPFIRMDDDAAEGGALTPIYLNARAVAQALSSDLQVFYRAVFEKLGDGIAANPRHRTHGKRPAGGVFWLRAWALRPHPEPGPA